MPNFNECYDRFVGAYAVANAQIEEKREKTADRYTKIKIRFVVTYHSGGKNGNEGILSDTHVFFFGPAANARATAEILDKLSGGKQNSLWLENHSNDFVGSIIGGNPATMTLTPAGK